MMNDGQIAVPWHTHPNELPLHLGWPSLSRRSKQKQSFRADYPPTNLSRSSTLVRSFILRVCTSRVELSEHRLPSFLYPPTSRSTIITIRSRSRSSFARRSTNRKDNGSYPPFVVALCWLSSNTPTRHVLFLSQPSTLNPLRWQCVGQFNFSPSCDAPAEVFPRFILMTEPHPRLVYFPWVSSQYASRSTTHQLPPPSPPFCHPVSVQLQSIARSNQLPLSWNRSGAKQHTEHKNPENF